MAAMLFSIATFNVKGRLLTCHAKAAKTQGTVTLIFGLLLC